MAERTPAVPRELEVLTPPLVLDSRREELRPAVVPGRPGTYSPCQSRLHACGRRRHGELSRVDGEAPEARVNRHPVLVGASRAERGSETGLTRELARRQRSCTHVDRGMGPCCAD